MRLEQPVIYVCRDIERALGLELPQALQEGYFIISNKTTFSEKLQMSLPEAWRKNIALIEATGSTPTSLLDTHELLSHDETRRFINALPSANILVFKNTLQIERICKERGWHLLNPSAALADRIEEKISQVEWLGELARFLPPHEITECGKIEWPAGNDTGKSASEPLILQFNHAHSGEGTTLIDSKEKLHALQEKFPKRLVRKTAYVRGPIFTCNAVVMPKTDSADEKNSVPTVLCGNISYQITGLAPFTDKPFATVGNDWSLARRLLTDTQRTRIHEIARTVGEHLRQSGWKGLFGIDVVAEEKKENDCNDSGKVFLLEINARQPASATFESTLQRAASASAKNDGGANEKSDDEKNEVTIFEAHLHALTESDDSSNAAGAISLIPISDGAQLIQRVTADFPANRSLKEIEAVISKLEQKNFRVIRYDNAENYHEKDYRAKGNSDFLRIQSAVHGADATDSDGGGFLKNHAGDSAELNDAGFSVANILSSRTLSPEALAVIADFLHLPPPLHGVACPYYNNRRTGMRAGLRPLIGKGSAHEICDETILIGLRKKVAIAKLTPDDARKFLVDNRIGIDCSGFAYHALDAESRARGFGSLRRHIARPWLKNPLRRLLALLRPAENTGVRSFANPKNSREITLADAQSGDFIVMLETGPQKTYNHIVVIHEIERGTKSGGTAKKLHYTHSFAWPSDGLHGHGVRQGVIEIIDPAQPLTEQTWIENSKTGHENFTLEKAREATSVSLRRLNWF